MRFDFLGRFNHTTESAFLPYEDCKISAYDE